MASSSSVVETMRILKEVNSPEQSRISALSSLRRSHLDDKKIMSLKDNEFCELCNVVIQESLTENEKLHIEACRTLDIVLPETRNRNFDFFDSVLQIHRKQRLKILESLSILKDETIAIVCRKHSVHDFLTDCLRSTQPINMEWLRDENADNSARLKMIESRISSEDEEFEEKLVDQSLKFLERLCGLSHVGLNIREFDKFIMEKVVPLAYMGHKKQRAEALAVLKIAIKSDIGLRIKSLHKDIWERYKNTLQNFYCKRMLLLVNLSEPDWSPLWESSITLIGTDLHRGSGLVNSLLKVEEVAFKSADPNRRQAFLSWKLLIDNFALDQRELATTRRIKLLCTPLNAKNSKTEVMVLTKLEVWWHLISKVYPSIAECVDSVLLPFLNMCFGPFGDKPLFAHKSDSNVSLGKKFPKTQLFAVDALVQLIVDRESEPQASLSMIQEKLPNPVSAAVFENKYKIFIHCFGEALLSLSMLPEDIQNKSVITKVIWESLLRRIGEYDKMKVQMYKEIACVIIELLKNNFHKKALIKNFLVDVVLKNFGTISSCTQFTEQNLVDLINLYLQVDNFSGYSHEHFQSMESLLMHLIKPKTTNNYYPKTLEIMRKVLQTLDDAKKNNAYNYAMCEVWCILARIAKMYVEDEQPINEGNLVRHKFETIENIIKFPFTSLQTDDRNLLRSMTEPWTELYKHFDFQAELIVSVKPNEILNQTSNMIISASKTSYEFATICIDGLLKAVNYDELPAPTEIPPFVMLLKKLSIESLSNKSFATEKVLKAFSSFLLNVFNHSVEKAAAYLKVSEPMVKVMLKTQTEDAELEKEITSIWSTIVNLYKKFENDLKYELLNCYRETIVTATLHLNNEISSAAMSMLDLKDGADEKMKQLTEKIMTELAVASPESNLQADEKKGKKIKIPLIKPIGSFLNRKNMSPSTLKKEMNGKESVTKAKVINPEPDSQDFVVINTDVRPDVSRMTDHQKDMLKKRRDDIPAMYNELTVSNSQDSQQLQRWFDAKSNVNNNEVVPKTTSSDSLHFKNIAQVFPDTQPKKTAASSPVSSPRAHTRRQSAAATATAASEESLPNQQNNKSVEPPTIVKKLNFESKEEYPVGTPTAEQVSPSMIEQTNKMRRRSNAEENNATDSTKNNQARLTRRSLHQPLDKAGTLRKYNSNEQLMGSKRGRKRRNSETGSEGTLDIEREKRFKKTDSSEILNSSEDSNKSSESTQEIDGKKVSNKRTINEMSRLKIDMVFNPMPNRRSVGKASEVDKKSGPKEEKQKEESNSQNSVRRRSMKGSVTIERETAVQKKDVENKKPEVTQNKIPTRRSLAGRIESIKKKIEVVPESQEVINIEDVTTQDETIDKIENNSIKPVTDSQETQESDKSSQESSQESDKSSQDSDIVESSQEPTMSKMDKVECFIKIAKVDLTQTSVAKNEESEKEPMDIPVTQSDFEDSSISIIPPTAEIEKPVPPQADVKKADTSNGKPTAPLPSLVSSPKSTPSRVIRAKVFPLQGRAAQMLGLVTKQSIAEKFAAEGLQESALTDEVTIVPLPKKDKPVVKEHDRVSSPGGSRQVKMFNNMNNNSVPQRCSSPSIATMGKFKNLNNDGEKVSPKLDKHEASEKESSQSSGEESPNSKCRRELPLLEWSNANPVSLTASPSASILKRLQQEMETPETPNRKKRVSFADPPVSREMGYEIMTETSSPPRLEKLPSLRSPSARKEFKRQSKLRLVHIDTETKEVEVIAQPIVDVELPSAKLKLATVLTEISIEELKANDSIDIVKTSTQEDKNDTSIKLDSINISNIGNESNDNRQTSLDDTVDVENISSSLEITQEKPASIPMSQGSEDRTLPVTDSLFSNLPLSQETQNSVAHLNEPENLDSTLPVYPSLISCADAVESLSADLVDPLFTSNLEVHLTTRAIHSIGDLAQLTERDINRLPIKSPKVDCLKKALSKYEDKINSTTRTPEKRPSVGVPSSTPIGPRRTTRARPDNDSFDELMKTSDLMSTNMSALKRPAKRLSTDSCVQTSPAKRTRKGDERQCLDLMEQCDDDVLFDAFVKRFGAEKILKGYKDKMGDKTEAELKRETLDILGLNMEDDSDASFKASTKTAGLQKVLRELPNIFDADDDKFTDAVLKTYKKKLKPSQLLKTIKANELKEAITDEFSSSELLGMLVNRLSKDNKQLTDSTDLKAMISRVPTNVIVGENESRSDLPTEVLLKLALEKCPENPSDDVNQVLLRILKEKYEFGKLLKLTQEALLLGWQKSSNK